MTAIILSCINLSIFLILKLIWIAAPSAIDSILEGCACPSSFAAFLSAPWTAFTYMFIHINFWHMLVNMLWLMWFGTLLEKVAGRAAMLTSYLGGGIAGAICFLLLDASAPVEASTCLLGASAATLSVCAATLVCAPGKRIEIPVAGLFPLKWIAAIGLIILIAGATEMTPQQTVAHAGGVLFGITSGCWLALKIRRRTQRMKAFARRQLSHQRLIDKARRSGHASLSREERLELFRLSHQDAASLTTK